MGTQVRRAREIVFDVSRIASSLCVALSVCLSVCSSLVCSIFFSQMSAVVLDEKPDGCARD